MPKRTISVKHKHTGQTFNMEVPDRLTDREVSELLVRTQPKVEYVSGAPGEEPAAEVVVGSIVNHKVEPEVKAE